MGARHTTRFRGQKEKFTVAYRVLHELLWKAEDLEPSLFASISQNASERHVPAPTAPGAYKEECPQM